MGLEGLKWRMEKRGALWGGGGPWQDGYFNHVTRQELDRVGVEQGLI